jgi:hypothetical protein
MPQMSALFSVVFMISFVMLYDRVRDQGRTGRFWKTGLLSSQELERISIILSACQDNA